MKVVVSCNSAAAFCWLHVARSKCMTQEMCRVEEGPAVPAAVSCISVSTLLSCHTTSTTLAGGLQCRTVTALSRDMYIKPVCCCHCDVATALSQASVK